jgi:hypothetical protein
MPSPGSPPSQSVSKTRSLCYCAPSTARLRQWQATAQLFARVIVSCFDSRFPDDADLIEHVPRAS